MWKNKFLLDTCVYLQIFCFSWSVENGLMSLFLDGNLSYVAQQVVYLEICRKSNLFAFFMDYGGYLVSGGNGLWAIKVIANTDSSNFPYWNENCHTNFWAMVNVNCDLWKGIGHTIQFQVFPFTGQLLVELN